MDTDSSPYETPRRLLWKLDVVLLPILTLSYGLQFYDKAVLGSASVFGIIEDLNLYSTTPSGAMDTARYSTATAAFYWGYMIAVLPISIILQRLPLGKTLAAAIFLWGVVVILTVVTTSYEGLTAQRFFLGAVESLVSPGFVAVTAMWYRKDEITSRMGIWYSSTGGVVNYGIGNASGPLAPWKYMYIFAGTITMATGILVLFIVPDSIESSSRFFNSDERKILQERIKSQSLGVYDKHWRKSQAIEAVKDPVLYVYFLMSAAIYICNGAVTAFGARIIRTFGYSSLHSILLQIPGGATTCISIYTDNYLTGKTCSGKFDTNFDVYSWICKRFKGLITYMLALSSLPPMSQYVGAIIIWKASWSNPGWPLFGYYLIPIFGAPYVMLLSLASNNVGGGTKKAICTGMIFIAYNVGNIIGPYTVLTPEEPVHYRSTFVAVICGMSFTIVASLSLRIWFKYQNKKRDQIESTCGGGGGGKNMEKTENALTSYLTDKTNLGFRYSL